MDILFVLWKSYLMYNQLNVEVIVSKRNFHYTLRILKLQYILLVVVLLHFEMLRVVLEIVLKIVVEFQKLSNDSIKGENLASNV